jgi:CRP-like cAMP-binding protein
MTRTNPTLERLGGLPLFAGCNERELAAVASRTTTVHARRGDVLMREGALGHEMLVIVEGTAGVFRRDRLLATLGPGDVCGELALIDDGPRSATVIATSELTAEVSSRHEFAELLAVVPRLARPLLRQLAMRLRDSMAN